jgi:hypothetical protein
VEKSTTFWYFNRGKKCITVDADSTVKTVYGNQEGAQKGYNPHRSQVSSPTSGFLQSYQGNKGGTGVEVTGNGIIDFTQQLMAHIPNNVHIMFRADSGFFNGNLMNYLEKYGHAYLIKVKLKNLNKLLAKQIWTEVPKQLGWDVCFGTLVRNGKKHVILSRYA